MAADLNMSVNEQKSGQCEAIKSTVKSIKEVACGMRVPIECLEWLIQ